MPRLLHRHIVRLKVETLAYICASRQIYMDVCAVHMYTSHCEFDTFIARLDPTRLDFTPLHSTLVCSVLLCSTQFSSVQFYFASPCLILIYVFVYACMLMNSSSYISFSEFSPAVTKINPNARTTDCQWDKMKREKYAAKTMLTTTTAMAATTIPHEPSIRVDFVQYIGFIAAVPIPNRLFLFCMFRVLLSPCVLKYMYLQVLFFSGIS